MLPTETKLAPSFDDPIALLLACHEKVRRFAHLSLRLDAHLTAHGVDSEASTAAGNILRYFDIAAPLHHADEENDLFPALRKLGDPALSKALDTLEAEHVKLAELWRAVRPWLESISQQGSPVRPATLTDFATRYIAHANQEEATVYPATQRLARATLDQLGRHMSQRRQSA